MLTLTKSLPWPAVASYASIRKVQFKEVSTQLKQLGVKMTPGGTPMSAISVCHEILTKNQSQLFPFER